MDSQDKLFEKLSGTEDLAIQIHDKLCKQNHTDGCGWYYEVSKDVHNWKGYSHAAWLKKSNKLFHFCRQTGITPEQALNAYEILDAYE